MSKSSIEFLRHILDESKFVLDNTKGMNYESFYKDEILKRAVVRSIEIIGEATKKIDDEMREKYGAIEWKSMAKTRDMRRSRKTGQKNLIILKSNGREKAKQA